MSEGRVKFGSRIGIILATAGAAVGLGNIWRFPYMTGANGGGAFILIYVACVLFLGVPCMIGEFIIGRRGDSNTFRAYEKVGKGSAWKWVGLMSVLTGFLITGYYAVVAGWCLQYFFASAFGELNGDAPRVASYFQQFSQNGWRPAAWTVVFLLATHYVIIHGVRKGIERASKFLMPALFVILLVIVVASCLLPGASAGIAFLFKPDFHKVDSGVFLGALGQSFYSLSIAMGCNCTYASYFRRRTNLMNTALQVSLLDLLVAILAGLMIFPAAFSAGISPDSGPSLVFITLPNIFNQAFSAVPLLSACMSMLFYFLLCVASLTSLISLHEVSTAFFHEELHVERRHAAVLVTVFTAVVGLMCSFSFVPRTALTISGRILFDCFDFVTGQVLLPVGGFLTCLFVGWYLPRKVLHGEFTNGGTVSTAFFTLWLWIVRVVCPVCILAIFLHQLGVF